MPAILLASLVAAGVVLAVSGRPRAMVGVLVTTWLLVPGPARLPGTGGGQLLIHRVIVAAVVLGLVRALILRRLPARVFAIRGTHLAFLTFLLVALVTGVVLAEARIPASAGTNTFAAMVEQGIFFAVALAAFRTVGARHAAVVITVTTGVLAAIAISEGLASWSYTQWFTRDLADPSGLLSLDLTTRGTHERVRGAASFALELGWITAMLVPISVAAAVTARRRARVIWAVPPMALIAMVWTWSRSAYAGLAVGLFVLALGVVVDRPRRAAPLAAVGLLLGAVLLQGPIRTVLDLGQTTGEQDVRFQRLPQLLDLAADRPVGGLGLGGLQVRRFVAVDLSWVNSYVTIGVLGVVALAGLLLTATHAATRFLLSGPNQTRVLAAGAAGGLVAAPIGMAAFDLFSLRNSTSTVWGLAALAMVAGEELGVLAVPLRRRAEIVPRPALVLGVLGLAGGFALATLVPTAYGVDALFTTVDPRAIAVQQRDNQYTSKVLSQTGCLVVDAATFEAHVECRDVDRIPGGVAELRIEAGDAQAARTAFAAVAATVEETFPHAVVALRSEGAGRPTWATTAPFWMLAGGFTIGCLIPDRAYRSAAPLSATPAPAT